MKPWLRTIFLIIAVLTVFSLVLTACGPLDGYGSGDDEDKGRGKDKDKDKEKDKGKDKEKPGKVTICHKTGSTSNPYVTLTVSNDAIAEGHGTHDGDIIPAPETGCPTE